MRAWRTLKQYLRTKGPVQMPDARGGVSESEVRDALRAIPTPHGGGDLVAAGVVSGIVIRNGNVHVSLEIEPAQAEAMEPVREAAEKAIRAVDGVLSATVVLTAERAGTDRAAAKPTSPGPAPRGGMRGRAPAGSPRAGELLPGVRAIVAVASGKGGVGKSTVAVNLALGLAAAGHRVGLLDADIYGPSLPRMMGIRGRPDSTDGKTLEPMENHGVRCMSIGFLVEEETPMIWRGPMVMGALQQMLGDVNWGELDVLVVDMPPGTGDAQLTMAQRVPLTGAVIVSTPQDIALLDARKGINMFRKVDVPVLGIVENMSTYVCPSCGHESHIFGHGGARAEAERLGVPFLGEIPLHIDVRLTGDAGEPIVASSPESPQAQAFRTIADRVWDAISARLETGRAPPRIVVE